MDTIVPDQGGLTMDETNNDDLFNKFKKLINELSENYLPRNVKTFESRKWYFDYKKEIEDIIEEYFDIPKIKYTEEKARLSFHIRNLLRI